LASLRLSPSRENDIVEESSQHLDDRCSRAPDAARSHQRVGGVQFQGVARLKADVTLT
jgi:hypothetical protein